MSAPVIAHHATSRHCIFHAHTVHTEKRALGRVAFCSLSISSFRLHFTELGPGILFRFFIYARSNVRLVLIKLVIISFIIVNCIAVTGAPGF